MPATWREANPRYEEMEGVVAGVPELSEFDVIIDAGADASDPENAVPFDVELPGGKVLEQPGNFFFLTETSLFGTNPDFQARGVEPDLDGDGKAGFGEAVPDADAVLAFTRDFAAQAKALDKAARVVGARARRRPAGARDDDADDQRVLRPVEELARFIAGAKADEQSFAAASRLQDIEDILAGLVTIYDNVRPAIAEVDPAQAEQTGRELKGLPNFASGLRVKEQSGTRFDADRPTRWAQRPRTARRRSPARSPRPPPQLGIELE